MSMGTGAIPADHTLIEDRGHAGMFPPGRQSSYLAGKQVSNVQIQHPPSVRRFSPEFHIAMFVM